MEIFFVLILIVLAAIVLDHYSRLTEMGWAPDVKQITRGHSPLDPAGAALGRLRARQGAVSHLRLAV